MSRDLHPQGGIAACSSETAQTAYVKAAKVDKASVTVELQNPIMP